MEGNPLVSIIMPTFNREKLLPLSIQTVINQKYANWELIVVDDRSADGTKALIESFSKKDGRIRYVANNRKKGPGGARNCGIAVSAGEYLAFLDSDDEWLEQHLWDSMEVLQNEGVDVCFALRYERHAGELVRLDQSENARQGFDGAVQKLKPKIKGDLFFFGEGFYEYNLTERFYLFHINTTVMKKDIIRTSGVFDENLPANEDYDFIFKVFHDFGFCFINRYHMIYNEGPDNLYSFTGRYNMKLEEAVHNRGLVDRITYNMRYKIQMHKNRKAFIRRSKRIKCKKECLEVIDRFVALKYFSLGYLNRNVRKGTALLFYLRSLRYRFQRLTLVFILSLLFPSLFDEARLGPDDLNMG